MPLKSASEPPFGTPTVFPVIHVQSEKQTLETVKVALQCQEGQKKGLIAGVFLTNDKQKEPSLAAFSPIALAVRKSFPDLWIGVNLFHTRLDPCEAFREVGELAKLGRIDGLWCDWAWIDEKSPLEAQKFARKAFAARQQSGWKGVYFGGVAFKGNPNYDTVSNFKQAGTIARNFVDVVVTSGPDDKAPPSVDKVTQLQSGCSPVCVAIASGITPGNVRNFLPVAKIFLVSDGISSDRHPIDPVKLQALLKAVEGGEEGKVESVAAPVSVSAPAEIREVAEFIKSGQVRKIAFLTGAGVSVAAGIPDFRSPGGLYQTLNPSLITATDKQKRSMARDPTMVVNWDLFQENQLPYLEVRRPFIVGTGLQQWKATLGHWFIRVCYDKGLLGRLYTQNIDGLDNQTDIPPELVVPVHGSLGSTSCEGCGATYPQDKFIEAVKKNIKDIYKTGVDAPEESKTIPCLSCNQPLVKPSTVLYGRQLPDRFHQSLDVDFADDKIDLLFIMGTSLTVGPANLIPGYVSKNCKRVYVNMEAGGRFTESNCNRNGRDYFFKGDIDQSLKILCDVLGWTDMLRSYANKMCPASAALLSKS